MIDTLEIGSSDLQSSYRPLGDIMPRFGGAEKPWGGLIALLMAGKIPFHLATLPGYGTHRRSTCRIHMDPKDIEEIVFPRYVAELDTRPAETLSQRDTMEMLNVTGSTLKKAVELDLIHFTKTKRNGLVADRARIADLASRYMSAGELAYRLGIDRTNLLMPGRIKPFPLDRDVLGWDRAMAMAKIKKLADE